MRDLVPGDGSGAIDGHVDAALRLGDGGRDPRECRPVGDIERMGGGLPAGFADLAGDPFGSRRIAVEHCDVSSRLCQGMAGRGIDVAAAAGDERDFSGEFLVHLGLQTARFGSECRSH